MNKFYTILFTFILRIIGIFIIIISLILLLMALSGFINSHINIYIITLLVLSGLLLIYLNHKIQQRIKIIKGVPVHFSKKRLVIAGTIYCTILFGTAFIAQDAANNFQVASDSKLIWDAYVLLLEPVKAYYSHHQSLPSSLEILDVPKNNNLVQSIEPDGQGNLIVTMGNVSVPKLVGKKFKLIPVIENGEITRLNCFAETLPDAYTISVCKKQ